MPFAEINGLQLFYHVQGPADPAAPAIVFVHGTQGNASLWASLIDDLADRYRCAALNHRGRLPSESPEDPAAYTIEQFADDQAVFLQQLDLRDVTMIGWSLGVRTTLSYLHRHGIDRVARAIFVSGPPSARFGGQPLTPPDHSAPPREVWGEQFYQSTAACWEGSQITRIACDMEFFLPQVNIPVGIFHGRHDPIAPYAAAEHMASTIPQNELVPFEQSGHAPLLTEPERFQEAVHDFIQRHSRPGGA